MDGLDVFKYKKQVKHQACVQVDEKVTVTFPTTQVTCQ